MMDGGELWTPRTGDAISTAKPVRGLNVPLLMFDPSAGGQPIGPYTVDSESKIFGKVSHGSWFIRLDEHSNDEVRELIHRLLPECEAAGLKIVASRQEAERLNIYFPLFESDHLQFIKSIKLVDDLRKTGRPVPTEREIREMTENE